MFRYFLLLFVFFGAQMFLSPLFSSELQKHSISADINSSVNNIANDGTSNTYEENNGTPNIVLNTAVVQQTISHAPPIPVLGSHTDSKLVRYDEQSKQNEQTSLMAKFYSPYSRFPFFKYVSSYVNKKNSEYFKISDIYSVKMIHEDKTSKNAIHAMRIARQKAYQVAIKTVIHRLVLANDWDRIPIPSFNSSVSFVKSYIVTHERRSRVRYTADFSVLLYRSSVEDYIQSFGVRMIDVPAHAAVLIPILVYKTQQNQVGRVVINCKSNSAHTLLPQTPINSDTWWCAGWQKLDLQNSVTPMVIPDIKYLKQFSVENIVNGDLATITAITKKYGAFSVVLAQIIINTDTKTNVPEGAVDGFLALDGASSADSNGSVSSLSSTLMHGTSVWLQKYVVDKDGGSDSNPAPLHAFAYIRDKSSSSIQRKLLLGLENQWIAKRLSIQGVKRRPYEISMSFIFSSLGQWDSMRKFVAGLRHVKKFSINVLTPRGATAHVTYEGSFEDFQKEIQDHDYNVVARRNGRWTVSSAMSKSN